MPSRRREPASPPLPPKLSSFCLLFVVGLSCGLLHSVSACPSDCVCKWKNGKQTVECVNRSLRTFPGPIDAGTQVLDVSGNSFETLPHDHFMRLGLINLQKIYLSKCRLSHINSKAFRGLSNLVELDLSQNVMREVPGAAFPDCQGLMKLFLNGNPIAVVQKNAFIALEALTLLEMSHCGVEVIEKGAFDGLVSLEWLKVNGNKLRRISGLRSLPVTLKGVWLEDNPWECDCRLLELRLWLGERNVANSVEPRCALPDRLTNCTLRELTVENFACTPQLSPTTMYQKIEEGKNVSLLCKVTSIPESSLEWLFNGKLLSNSSLNMLIETTSSFVSISQHPSPTVGGSAQGYGGNQLSSPASTSTSSTMSMSLSVMSTGQGTLSVTSFGTMSERKSELVILNATSEENGTFTCMAQNPAGIAMANFTLRVLTAREDVEVSGIGLTSFVSHYPNLIIIVLSTGAVIGVVIVLCVIIVCICKCYRVCGSKRRRGESSVDNSPESRRAKSKRKGKGKGGVAKDAKEVTTMNSVVSSLGGCGGKLDRHLSETSTLTTHTKSNGSVFLLSTSSELGLGDSNPDLIEGVKRVEGDGHDHTFYKNGGVYAVSSTSSEPQPPSTSHQHSQQTLPKVSKRQQGQQLQAAASSSASTMTLQQHHHPQGHYSLSSTSHCSGGGAANPGTIVMEPPPFNVYPVDYGLPKSLNVSTLVRRSPSYPMSLNTTIPPTYDLAKYPKEYINPQQQLSSSPTYGYSSTPPPTQTIYAHAHGHQHTLPHGAGHSHSNHNGSPNSNPDDYPTTYILPHGAYVTTYNGPSGEEYTVTMDNYPHNHGPQSSCTCMPILEGNESEEKNDNDEEALNIPAPPPPVSPMRKPGAKIHGHCHGHPASSASTQQSPARQGSECTSADTETNKPTLMISSSTSTTNLGASCSGGGGSAGCSGQGHKAAVLGQANVNARLHRQLTTQINESPDEGYEDESAEGTEI